MAGKKIASVVDAPKVESNGAKGADYDPIEAARQRYEQGRAKRDHDRSGQVLHAEAGWRYTCIHVGRPDDDAQRVKNAGLRALLLERGYEFVAGPVEPHKEWPRALGERREVMVGDPRAEIWRVPRVVFRQSRQDKLARIKPRPEEDADMKQARKIAALIRSGAA